MNTTETLRDDISSLRKLAESGRRGPILGGIFLAGAGVVFGLACFVSGAADMGLLPLAGWAQLYLWLGAFGVFALFWLFMFWQLKGRSPAPVANHSTAVFGTIWGASGAGVMVAFFSTLVVASVANSTLVLAAYIPVIFAFYGTAWFASAALAKRAWMALAGGVSFVFAFIMAVLTNTPAQSLAMGVGLLLLLTLPGLKLAQDEAKR
jgi:hypothetical protein